MTNMSTDGWALADLAVRYARQEGLIGSVGEEEFTRITKAFMAGYTHGLHGNAEAAPEPALLPPGDADMARIGALRDCCETVYGRQGHAGTCPNSLMSCGEDRFWSWAPPDRSSGKR